ncbi:hypothetical protein H072_2556 [Dactylellina haptotyla CBS 200.50]|uniref:Rab-GAP TBC domain-containing protein n=1 Tax=Dactylellina haptotyla (strain CBS 200.50) TaxID=1284197 RepID=S8BVH3_DACHA|nr:hypothetical protein H072_2556 [Dactylellina haptotyla CBS 200.50]
MSLGNGIEKKSWDSELSPTSNNNPSFQPLPSISTSCASHDLATGSSTKDPSDRPTPIQLTNPPSISETSHHATEGHSPEVTLPKVSSALTTPQVNFAHPNISKISLQGTGRSIVRELTIDEELLSLKVRSLYDSMVQPLESQSFVGSVPSGSVRAGLDNNRLSAISTTSIKPQTTSSSARNSTANSTKSLKLDTQSQDTRSEFELAGGAEDWEDVDADDIDRYGFIMPKPRRSSTNNLKSDTPNKSGHKKSRYIPFVKYGSTKWQARTASTRNRHLNVLRLPFNTKSAPEMLTSPIAGSNERMKAKEVKRVTKWHSMARRSAEQSIVGGVASDGRGMSFDFPTTNPKSLLTQNSPDDVQIDLDVPRTISSHIMFRRRYRGGQRLLFRVLHASSLYFPDIGYVQGMASLAATFLCYYDEDAAFIMLVRLFELRGLHTLYSNGFGGLMDALNEFDAEWLRPGHPLEALGISVLAFGTRWYLTLFNYSIPFAAQLRVWDIFLLLGDDETNNAHDPGTPSNFGSILDVLHATSAALIDGMEDIVLSSDFEASMKCLTSWIPIKDEDTLMRSVKAEWGRKKRRKLIERFPRGLLSNGNQPDTTASRTG